MTGEGKAPNAAWLASLSRHPVEPHPPVDLWNGVEGWRRVRGGVEARALAPLRPMEDRSRPLGMQTGASAPLVERPRYLLRARDVLLVGQRALIDMSVPAAPRLFNDVSLLPPPFFDPARPLSAFPHEFRMTPWVERQGETLRIREPGEVLEIAEPVVAVSSTEIRNYGSWLFRVVPKLLLLRELGAEAEGRALLVPVERPFMREILDLFAPDRAVIAQDPTRLHHLSDALVPSLAAAGNVFPPLVRERLHELASRHRPLEGASPERIYVSRRLFSEATPRRVLVNEGDVAAALGSLGFAEVFPERLALPERIALFAGAKLVVGPTGSGLFNSIFCPPGTIVIELEPHGEFRVMHAALYRSMGFAYAFLRGSIVGSGVDPAHPDWFIDPKLCRQALGKLLSFP